MGLTDALFAGTSGLRSLGHGMSVIGDNVSNLNTSAFKGARITFSDVMAQRINTASGSGQMGRGSSINALFPMMQQGSFESTASPTDLAIAGNGFFILKDSNSNGNTFYTRDGQFLIEKDGFLVNPAGFHVQGWKIDKVTQDITGSITDIKIDKSSPPQKTQKVDLITNLDAREEIESQIVSIEGDIDGENSIKITQGIIQFDNDTSTLPILKDSDITGPFKFLDDNFQEKQVYIRQIRFSSYDIDSDNKLTNYTWEVEYSLDGSTWETATVSNSDFVSVNKPNFSFTIDLSNVEKRYGSSDSDGSAFDEDDIKRNGTKAQTTDLVLRDINGQDKKVRVGLLYNSGTQTWSYKISDLDTGAILISEENTTSKQAVIALDTGEKFTIDWSKVTHVSTKEDGINIIAATGLIELDLPGFPANVLSQWNRFDFEAIDSQNNKHYLEAWLQYDNGNWNYLVVEVDNPEAHNNLSSPPITLNSDGTAIQSISEDLVGNILAVGINHPLPGGSAPKNISFYLANSTEEIHLDWSKLDDNTATDKIFLYGMVNESNASDSTGATGTAIRLTFNNNMREYKFRYNGTNYQYWDGSSWQDFSSSDADGQYIEVDDNGNIVSSGGTYKIYINDQKVGHTTSNPRLYLSQRETYKTETMETLFDKWDARRDTPVSNTDYVYRTTLNIYDSLGIPHEITVYFDRTTEDNVYEFLIVTNPNEDQRDFVRDLQDPLTELNEGIFSPNSNIPPTPMYKRDDETYETIFVPSANTNLSSKRGVLMYGRIQFDRQGNIIQFKETYRLDPNTGEKVQLFKPDGGIVEVADDGFPVLGESGYPLLITDFLGLNLDDPDKKEANMADIQQIELNMGYYFKDGRWRQESVRTTQYATSHSTIFYDQDGYGPGYLESISVDTEGVITGHYSNGRVVPLWMVALANFNAPEMLDKAGGNLFRETSHSGPPVTGKPGTNGLGSIAPNSLEQSNVDLGEQFVKMITIQRGFQADARTITVTDAMLEELINIKR